LGTSAPARAVGSDVFRPLIEIWQTLHDDPAKLKAWYSERRQAMLGGNKVEEYERIKASYNGSPNGADGVQHPEPGRPVPAGGSGELRTFHAETVSNGRPFAR
jgi:hypothetical protein